AAGLRVSQQPAAAAVLVTLLIATSPFAQIPFMVREVLHMVALLPMLRLTQPVVTASVVPGLYALGGLFALDIVLQALAGAPRLSQGLLIGETLVGLLVAGWVLGHPRRGPRRGGGVVQGGGPPPGHRALGAPMRGRVSA